jgi:acetyl-CoA carboxylase biotin carboxylase subunit
MVTGVDLVEWQIRIARGERLTIDAAAAASPRGHAIECRIYAEDPDAGFLPSPGRITGLRVPHGPGIRDDSGAEPGADVPIDYDPLVSKLVAWGDDRPHAVARMRRALREYEVLGIRTTVPFFRWLLEQPAFGNAAFHTDYLDELVQQRQGAPFTTATKDDEEMAAIAAALCTARVAAPASAPPAGATTARLERSRVLRESPLAGRTAGWRTRARCEGLRS